MESTDILRIVCGAFFIPHVIGKITARQAVFGFFGAAGFSPQAPYVYSAMVVETVVAFCLIGGFYTRYAALVGAGFLAVAALAVLRVSKGRWLWNLGGCEYPIFWMLCCLVVAAHS